MSIGLHRRCLTAAILVLLPAVLWAATDRRTAPYSDDQAAAGQQLYAEKCTGCHNADLSDGGHGPGLKGDFFWTTWNGQTARRLYGRILSTMPASDPGSLNPNQALALTAFILKENGYASSGQHLDDAEPLGHLTIDAKAGE